MDDRRASILDRITGLTIAAAAVVVAASFAVRTFRPQPGLASPHPTFVPNWKVALSVGHRIGNPAAPVTIVDIADLQCPVCRALYTGALTAVLHDRAASVAVVHVAYPLSYHAQAMAAARAAECAAADGRFAAWVDAVYNHQDLLPTEPGEDLRLRRGFTIRLPSCGVRMTRR